jgi:hypothetical protein
MHALPLLLLSLSVLPSGAAATTPTAACHWQSIALPEHAQMANGTIQTLLSQVEGVQASDDATTLVDLLGRAPLPLGELAGQWKVRSLQFTRMFGGAGQVFAYPFFNALIDHNPCGYHFAKTSGSQRRSGQLYSVAGALRLTFLGASTINTGQPGDYDAQRPLDQQRPGNANSAGYLQRIGPDELLMVLDTADGDFELYHLKR